jgi:transcriptional regulator with XRE-family HTH domain
MNEHNARREQDADKRIEAGATDLNSRTGLLVRYERRKQGISPERLAKLARVTRRTVMRHERGEAAIGIPTLEAYCRVLGLPLLSLLAAALVPSGVGPEA